MLWDRQSGHYDKTSNPIDILDQIETLVCGLLSASEKSGGKSMSWTSRITH